MTEMTLDSFLTTVGSIVQGVVGWMGYVWTFITDNPVLVCLVLGVPLCGIGVSYLSRIIRL